MRFTFEPELLAHMEKKGLRTLSVEVAETNASDIEVTELFLRLVKEDFADYLVSKKRYRRYDAGAVSVLMPPYRLELDEEITFGLKKLWIFHKYTYAGIRL